MSLPTDIVGLINLSNEVDDDNCCANPKENTDQRSGRAIIGIRVRKFYRAIRWRFSGETVVAGIADLMTIPLARRFKFPNLATTVVALRQVASRITVTLAEAV